jgi:nucleoside-diphosphate-sugar epimerase
MQILIVGGAGEVGRHLIEDFTLKGHSLRILDLAPKTQEMETNPGLTYFQGNLTDKELVQRAVEGCDAVINLAWSFSDDPHKIFGTDIIGTATLLDEALSAGVQSFIYASTAVVYGRAAFHPVTEEHPCLIEEARKPFYALGKYSAEKLCLIKYRERGLPVSVLRFWWAYGNSIGGRHLRDIVKTALGNQPISIVQDAGGAFVTMNDLASVMSLMLGNSASAGQTFNAGSLFLTWEEVGRMIIELTHSSSALQLVLSAQWKGPAFLNEVWDLNWDKAADILGYRPLHTDSEARSQFREALKDCVAQLKQ